MSEQINDYRENVRLLQDAFGVAVEPPKTAGGYYVLKTGSSRLESTMSALQPFSKAVRTPFQVVWAEHKDGRVHMSFSEPSADACVLLAPETFSNWRAAQQSGQKAYGI